ncbi:uncharacterized protein LOC120551227 [Perca fluviatilis]|uniref:uncharacterized protein LOC120551227 n=1 Tax=Perca fluviatilis TaxID=8168 RepID=UPI001965C220|nr:uncharacterized protein LOC120551227 [Perca fluviatilis]
MSTRLFGYQDGSSAEEECMEWNCIAPGTPPIQHGLFAPLTATGSPQSSSSSSSSSHMSLESFLAPPHMSPPLPPSLLIRSPIPSPNPPGHLFFPQSSDVLQLTGGHVCSDIVGDDQADGLVTTLFIDSVKTASLHLLNVVLYRYWGEICQGCQINHPSQKQHECLGSIPEGFYVRHFEQLMKRLLTDKFVPVVQRFLAMKHLCADGARIRAVAETVLNELKTVEDVTVKIREMYDAMIGEDVIKVAEIREIGDYWRDLYERKNCV